MEFWLFFAAVLIPGVLIFAVPWYLKRARHQTAIANIKNKRGVLTTWQYTPAEWRFAAQENFNLRPKDGETGQVSFTPQYIFVTSGKKDFLMELVGSDKHVKHLTEVYLLKTSPMHSIKFEVRQKTIRKDQDGNETEKCSSEDFYVSIPNNFQPETDKVMKFYENILDDNADAVAAVMPYGLGMFGK